MPPLRGEGKRSHAGRRHNVADNGQGLPPPETGRCTVPRSAWQNSTSRPPLPRSARGPRNSRRRRRAARAWRWWPSRVRRRSIDLPSRCRRRWHSAIVARAFSCAAALRRPRAVERDRRWSVQGTAPTSRESLGRRSLRGSAFPGRAWERGTNRCHRLSLCGLVQEAIIRQFWANRQAGGLAGMGQVVVGEFDRRRSPPAGRRPGAQDRGPATAGPGPDRHVGRRIGISTSSA